MRDINHQHDTLKNQKLHLETQGLPAVNIQKCEKSLTKFNLQKLAKSDEKTYREPLRELKNYLNFFVQYYQVLKDLNLEILTKNNTIESPINKRPQTTPGSNLLIDVSLKQNQKKQDNSCSIHEAPSPKTNSITNEDLLDLMDKAINKNALSQIKSTPFYHLKSQ